MQTFETEDHDIGFSASFVPAGGSGDLDAAVVVSAPCRVDAHRLPQQGRFDAPGPGTLTLTWDNAYSMFRAKNLLYSVVRGCGRPRVCLAGPASASAGHCLVHTSMSTPPPTTHTLPCEHIDPPSLPRTPGSL
jgi:hypothetical protein